MTDKNIDIDELASVVCCLVTNGSVVIAEDVPRRLLVKNSWIASLTNAASEHLPKINEHKSPSIIIELLYTAKSAALNFTIASPDVFSFQIPFNIPEGQQDIATPSAKAPIHVLVAEDDAMNQRLITVYIEQEGYKITLVNNGLEAVEYLEKHADTVDIVLMDMNMPVMDGQQAVNAIRSSENTAMKYIPVLALTAHGQDEARRYKGMNGYVLKPIDRHILYATISKTIKPQD